jgi:hypothetical protein
MRAMLGVSIPSLLDRSYGGVAQPAATAEMFHPDNELRLDPPSAASAHGRDCRLGHTTSRSSRRLSASRCGPLSAKSNLDAHWEALRIEGALLWRAQSWAFEFGRAFLALLSFPFFGNEFRLEQSVRSSPLSSMSAIAKVYSDLGLGSLPTKRPRLGQCRPTSRRRSAGITSQMAESLRAA